MEMSCPLTSSPKGVEINTEDYLKVLEDTLDEQDHWGMPLHLPATLGIFT
jgi:hypothetical protein